MFSIGGDQGQERKCFGNFSKSSGYFDDLFFGSIL
jgi:hypothetical protein